MFREDRRQRVRATRWQGAACPLQQSLQTSLVLSVLCCLRRVLLLLLLQLKPAGVSQLEQRVLDMEGNASHWSLKDR